MRRPQIARARPVEEMTPAELSTIDLVPDRGQRVLSLPPPEKSSLISATPHQLQAVCARMFDLWTRIFGLSADDLVSKLEWTCDHGISHTIEGDRVRQRLFLVITAYYDFAVRKYLTGTESRDLPPGFNLNASKAILDAPNPLDATERNVLEIQLRILSHSYLLAMTALFFVKLLRNTPLPREALGEFEKVSHELLSDLYTLDAKLVAGDARLACRRLFLGVLRLAEQVYSETLTWNKDHRPGPFSALRLSELALLARRDAALVRRYGEKQIEKIFESQLSLIAQSFGLYVVRTRSGHRTVDLVCISGQSEERVSFLLEAKTGAGAYALPRKDYRALREYVDDIRRTLTTLPALRFVLVVGHRAAGTLHTKLRELEHETGIPFRFAEAGLIASLRERLPGVLPLRRFVNEILASDVVIGPATLDLIVESYKLEQRAHTAFIETMLYARGIIPACADWQSHPDGEAAGSHDEV